MAPSRDRLSRIGFLNRLALLGRLWSIVGRIDRRNRTNQSVRNDRAERLPRIPCGPSLRPSSYFVARPEAAEVLPGLNSRPPLSHTLLSLLTEAALSITVIRL